MNSPSEPMSLLNKRELEAYILENMQKWNAPGLSICIVKDGKTVLAKGYGTREVGQDLPVDENTLFPITGTTRSFTASALALLVSEGKMAWEDRMIDLLPSFRTGSDLVTYHTTVTDVLAHRTGLQCELLSWYPHPDLSRRDLLNRIQHMQSLHEFRSRWSFSVLLNVAAGEIIPTLTGTSWDDFIRDRLFKPVGMKDSITGPHSICANNNIATPHDREGEKLVPISHFPTSTIGPAISIYSSAADMAKWLIFQLNNCKVGDETIIPREEVDMMRASHMVANFSFPGIANHFINEGLGLLISDSRHGHKIYSGGGDVEGMEAYHAFIPELDLGIAIMVNTLKAIPQKLTAWIIDRYTGAPYKDWIGEDLSTSKERHAAFQSALDQDRKNITDPLKKTSLPLDAYTGIYRHPLLGDMTVRGTDGLTFTLGKTFEGNLKHANHDTFYLEVTAPSIGKFIFKGAVQFRLDQTGKVASLFVEDKEFKKQAAAAAN